MAQQLSPTSPGGNSRPNRASSSLSASGNLALSASQGTLARIDDVEPEVRIPKHLSTTSLTRRRKLAKSTGNLHGYMAEDYSRLNWPLPKMFGMERYGYSLIDIEDKRYLKECGQMSKRLIRLNYDLQIIDLEWRKTYKALLDAEHRLATLPQNCQAKTKDILDKEVKKHHASLTELQDQRDLYANYQQDIFSRCDKIKADIQKETDLEELRMMMEKQTRERVGRDDKFWGTKFNALAADRAAEKRKQGADFDMHGRGGIISQAIGIKFQDDYGGQEQHGATIGR